MEHDSEKTEKPLSERSADALARYSAIESSVYSSNISPRDKALRSLALPIAIGYAALTYVSAPVLAYLGFSGTIALIALLIWLPAKDGKASKENSTQS
jgi:hypothetical protein